MKNLPSFRPLSGNKVSERALSIVIIERAVFVPSRGIRYLSDYNNLSEVSESFSSPLGE